ncbi:hypothetical protein KFL_003250140 [Klebsormidium nitens]|uniref:IQ motif and ubiquitin-like domain-containing protein n=1 Tax=Klebsormidium nitens TaxID=105231 RepID=A0A1Y1ID28_KLENI|nr:hypothetical protein KFL_003250140 [Klebsormidium nitens]|eukprot:GAQ87011.1 hypothetical protein KFL_003250140 [Klebsormidium nitens]
MQGAMEAAEAQASSAEAGVPRSPAQVVPKMQDFATGTALLDPRLVSSENNEAVAEEKLLDAIPRAAAGSPEDAAGSEPAMPDRSVRAEQQAPPDRQHAAGSRASDGSSVSPLPSDSSHGELPASEASGEFQGGPESQAEAGGEAQDGALRGGAVTCSFTVLPEGYRHRLVTQSGMSIGEVLQQIAQELSVPAFVLQAQQAGQDLRPEQVLGALLKEADQADAEMSNNCLELELLLDFSRSDPHLEAEGGNPDAQEGARQEQARRAAMQIERCTTKQPFLGGYRNKQTGVEYLNAAAQCERPSVMSASERKLSRDTQTYDQKHVALQSIKEAATQMARSDLMLDESRDRVVLPRAYEDSEHWERRRDHAVIMLQRYWRGWLARRRAGELREREEEKQHFLQEEQQRRRQAAEAFRRGEIERRLQPRTAADFDILYSELEAWRMQETRKIKESVSEEEARKPALRQLLHKETKLLQTIDRLKLAAGKENRSTRIARSLASMAAPKQWELRDGNKVEVQTPLTVRAAELMQLYQGLRLRALRPEQRLDVVRHVQWTVREFDCALTRELLQLLAREEDLLQRGRPASTLEGLRRRIANLFLQFVETPEFNPEAERYRIAVPDFDAYQNQDPTRRNVRPSEVVL